jgi:hypothetical protein
MIAPFRPAFRADHGYPRRSERQHLLDRLAGDAEFPSDVGLGDALVDERLHEVAALAGVLLRQAGVVQGLLADCPKL